MAWTEIITKRTRGGRHWQETATGKARFEARLGTALHYESAPDSGILDSVVDMTPQHVTNAQLEGWTVTAAGWHYELGQPITGAMAGLDGVVGFGGRRGQNWIRFRLVRYGYLRYAQRTWNDLGSIPTYNRANLSSQTEALAIGPNSETINAITRATWSNVWPGVDIAWRAEGQKLKEEIIVSQTLRESLPNPPWPAAQAYFGFVFRLDVSDVPRWVKNGIIQNIEGDFDDSDGPIEIRDGLGQFLGLLPIDYARSTGSSLTQTVRLRKRVWKDPDGNYYLLVGAPVLDLNALPAGGILFDPTITLQPDAAGIDTMIVNAAPTTNYGTDTTLSVGEISSQVGRTLIKFDITTIPDLLTDATLSIMPTADYSTSARILSVYRVKVAWVETQATWNIRSTGNNWQTAGCAGANDRESTAVGSVSVSATQTLEAFVNIPLTPLNKVDIDLGNGWLLQVATESGDAYLYHSSDYATAGSRPKLVANYVINIPRMLVEN